MRERPDVKGHRAFLVGEVKDLVRGEPLNWSLTRKTFQGVQLSPWGVVTKINMGADTGFLEGRKIKLAMGILQTVFTEKLVEISLSGNPQVSGNIETLAPCLFLKTIKLNKTKVFGELASFTRFQLLEVLDIGDKKDWRGYRGPARNRHVGGVELEVDQSDWGC